MSESKINRVVNICGIKTVEDTAVFHRECEVLCIGKPKYSNKYLGNSKKVKIDSYVENPNPLKNNQASYSPPN